jgi:hypothetical protein
MTQNIRYMLYAFICCFLAVGCGSASDDPTPEQMIDSGEDASTPAQTTGGSASIGTGGSSAFATGGSVTAATGGQQATSTGGSASKGTGGTSSTMPACPTGTPCALGNLTACNAFVIARQACTATLCAASPGSECTSLGTCPTGYQKQSFMADWVCCQQTFPYSDNPTKKVLECGIYGNW